MVHAIMRIDKENGAGPSPKMRSAGPSPKIKSGKKAALCIKRTAGLVKALEKEWETFVPGLITELLIHKKLLTRIEHQFRSHKLVRFSQRIQSCARRLYNLRTLDLREITKGRTFSDGMSALIQRLTDLCLLLSQLASYTEMTTAISTQCLAQEHYFFFGSDVSILAVTSRVWVMVQAISKKIQAGLEDIRHCLEDFAVAHRVKNAKKPDSVAPEIGSHGEESAVDNTVINHCLLKKRGNVMNGLGIEKQSVNRSRSVASSNALKRFVPAGQ